jgi:hypothetical protein
MLLLSCFTTAYADSAAAIPGGPVNVYISNAKAASPLVWETMRTETEDIMHLAGVPIVWHGGGSYVAGRLAVIRLQGSCQADAQLPFGMIVSGASNDPEALGKTHVSNGEVLPFADILCDQIHKFILTPLRSGANAAIRDQMLGRALARVIAHELYHIVLKTKEHGKSGIARATQSAMQLVAPRIVFSRADEKRLASEINGEDVVADTGIESDGLDRNLDRKEN